MSKRPLTRRQFLVAGSVAGSGALLVPWFLRQRRPDFEVRIVGAPAARGHLLRKAVFPEPSETQNAGVVIVGGGMAGLSAAWELERGGYKNFTLLELDEEVGGNSRSGENAISPYPWGAHYVPLPGPEARYVRELFEELGIITGYDGEKLPIYDDFFLCAAPDERLFIHGQWQGGLFPQVGSGAAEREEARLFQAKIEEFRSAVGHDGRRAFTIPLDLSSQDPRFTRLDSLTLTQYLDELGLRSDFLRWYVDYCCRDDYGTSAHQVSAWAGMHYFASRGGKASGVTGHPVLTWPQGNGWLVQKLKAKLAKYIQPDSVVFRIDNGGTRPFVDVFKVRENRTVRIQAQSVVCAVPRFVAGRIITELRETPPAYLSDFSYVPWMVANISIRVPLGSSPDWQTWDNVLFNSASLGYVVATHQQTALSLERTVLTYYLPLTEGTPEEARRQALARPAEEWRKLIIADLKTAHPDLEEQIERIDIWIWGHAMIRPSVGFISGASRRAAVKSLKKIHFAHSDMSGISIFEEAQYRGVLAAQKAMRDVIRVSEEPS